MRAFFFLVLPAFFSVSAYAQYNSDNLKVENLSAEKKLAYKNLRVYPIRANSDFIKAHKDLGNYTTLKEAMEKKQIIITEKVNQPTPANTNTNLQNTRSGRNVSINENGVVNTLYAENTSKDTIILMAGEVVTGGKQDRVLAADIVLPPNSGKVELSVFCVEHGRWSTKSSGYQFNGYFNVSSANVRKNAVVKKDQQEVWKEVEVTRVKNKEVSKMNNPNQAYNTTDAYADIAADTTYNNTLNEYLTYFGALFQSDTTIIGVVAATGDTIIGCDMFATHILFRKQYPNLIQSYITEATTNGGEVKISDEKVQQYVANILSDESKQEEKVKQNGEMLKTKTNKKLHIATF